jgi:hypothetical protein
MVIDERQGSGGRGPSRGGDQGQAEPVEQYPKTLRLLPVPDRDLMAGGQRQPGQLVTR